MGKVEPAVVSRSPTVVNCCELHKSFIIQLASMYCLYILNLTDNRRCGHGSRNLICVPLFLDMMFRYDTGNPVNGGDQPTVHLHHIKIAQVFSTCLQLQHSIRYSDTG